MMSLEARMGRVIKIVAQIALYKLYSRATGKAHPELGAQRFATKPAGVLTVSS
jgi:hypothetical protein